MRRMCLGVAAAALVGFAGLGAAEAASAPTLPTQAGAQAGPGVAVVQADWVYSHGHRHWRRPPPRHWDRHRRPYYR